MNDPLYTSEIRADACRAGIITGTTINDKKT
jgi:hypothetical protein